MTYFWILYISSIISYYTTSIFLDTITLTYPKSTNKIQTYKSISDMKTMWSKGFISTTINFLSSVPLCIYIYCYFMEDKFKNNSKNYFFSIIMMIIYTYISVIYFYFCHRLFHMNKTLYRYIHKYHHRWTKPICIASLAAHPFEVIFCNIFTFSNSRIIL